MGPWRAAVLRTGAWRGLASSVGPSAMAGLSIQQKHPQGWLHQRGPAGSCWLVPWRFLWFQSRKLQLKDIWKGALWGHPVGRCLARCEGSYSLGWPRLLESHPLARSSAFPSDSALFFPPAFASPQHSALRNPPERTSPLLPCPHPHPASWRLGQHRSALPAQTLG